MNAKKHVCFLRDKTTVLEYLNILSVYFTIDFLLDILTGLLKIIIIIVGKSKLRFDKNLCQLKKR